LRQFLESARRQIMASRITGFEMSLLTSSPCGFRPAESVHSRTGPGNVEKDPVKGDAR